MSNLTKSCLKMLFVYAVLAVAIGVAVHHRFPMMGPAIWSGIIAGFFLWLVLAYLWAIPMHIRDWWRMRPGAEPVDGGRVAVMGPVRAAGSALHAPFSKTPCIAYQYKVQSLAGENPSTDYEGFGMVPGYVATEHGQVRLLAYPELEIPDEPVRGAEVKQNAREFIDSTTFMDIRVEGIKAAAKELRNLLADDDGTMRYDHRVAPVAESLDQCRFTERVLREGETICAIGRYSEERKALVPDPKGVVSAIVIRKGEPGPLRRRMLRKAFGSAIGVVFCATLVAAAALIFLVNVPMDASEQMNPARRFLWEEVKLERWIEKRVRTPLAEAGTISTPGMHFLQLCDHCVTGRLEANDRVIELRHASGWQDETTRVIHLAAREGEKDGVTMTFNRKGGAWKVSVTVNGTEFAVPESWTLPTDVQTSFSTTDVADGRVTVVDPNDNVRVRASFRAPIENR